MARESGKRRDRRPPSTGPRQMPFGAVRNSYPPIAMLSADELESIHVASLRLLSEIGMEVMHDESRALLKAAGATVDESNQRVRFDPAMVALVAQEKVPVILMHMQGTPRTMQAESNPASRARSASFSCGSIPR